MRKLLADFRFAPSTGIRGRGALGLEGDVANNAPNIFNRFVTSAIGLMTIIAAIWFVFLFFTGAISIIASGGDKGALEDARKRLTTGIIGLVIVISAIFAISLAGKLLGFDLILDPAGAFMRIAPATP
jgi:hypothetical protein